jgi:Uma2 family endonuclease
MTVVPRRPWTAEELVRLPDGWRYEIDEGELVIMTPAGFQHGRLVSRVDTMLRSFVDAHNLGEVLAGEAGFFVRRDPDTLRAPDVAFYSHERLSRIRDRSGFPEVPPDLAVEVHDPSEPDLDRKVRQYLEAGVRAVWVLDPGLRTLTRYAPEEPPRTWSSPDDEITEPVLPGFSCRLGDFLD